MKNNLKISFHIWVLLSFLSPAFSFGGGVTLITHGFNSNSRDWILPMANAMSQYPIFPGESSCYEIYFQLRNDGLYYPMQRKLSGANPLDSTSAEIIIKLDWSPFDGNLVGANTSTTVVAENISNVLKDPTFIPELEGRALVELPIHFIGHSRGASLVAEISRFLGESGIWIDHLTTLDPHPCNNDGFGGLESLLCSAVDGSVQVYSNVMFADNYWQTNFGIFDPNGEWISGAYNRYLNNLTGGYGNPHSDVHLWYHSTIDFSMPFTSDTQSAITSENREEWFTSFERNGYHAGFHYSLIGRGDRLSDFRPAGQGTAAIRDGFNQFWDFGAGSSNNRTLLPENNGEWPNLLTMHLNGKNYYEGANEDFGLRVKTFFGAPRDLQNLEIYLSPANRPSKLAVFLDSDFNPFNSNETLVYTYLLSFESPNTVQRFPIHFMIPEDLTNDLFSIGAKIEAGEKQRSIYASEFFYLTDNYLRIDPPTFENETAELHLSGTANKTVHVFASENLLDWKVIGSTQLIADSNNPTLGLGTLDDSENRSVSRFYRASY